MPEPSQPAKLALAAAEEILRSIYGDDLKGCSVSLDQVAAPVQEALRLSAAENSALLEVYEKVVEAIHLLASPPQNAQSLDPGQLRSLLSERLDMIRSVTQRTMDTTAKVKSDRPQT